MIFDVLLTKIDLQVPFQWKKKGYTTIHKWGSGEKSYGLPSFRRSNFFYLFALKKIIRLAVIQAEWNFLLFLLKYNDFAMVSRLFEGKTSQVPNNRGDFEGLLRKNSAPSRIILLFEQNFTAKRRISAVFTAASRIILLKAVKTDERAVKTAIQPVLLL